MKKLMLTWVFTLLAFGFAFDSQLAEESSAALTGALSSVLGDASGSPEYLPGYGVHISLASPFGELEASAVRSSLTDLLERLATTVNGLDPNDWVSVSYSSGMTQYAVLARIKPGQADTLEVWLDGVKQ